MKPALGRPRHADSRMFNHLPRFLIKHRHQTRALSNQTRALSNQTWALSTAGAGGEKQKWRHKYMVELLRRSSLERRNEQVSSFTTILPYYHTTLRIYESTNLLI